VIELFFALLRREFLDDRMPGRVGDILGNLAAKGAVAERSEARLQGIESAVQGKIRVLLAETLEVSESVFAMKDTRP